MASFLLSPPPQLVERTDLRSGPVVHPGLPGKKFGVIFTTTVKGTDPSESRSLHTGWLTGARITNLDLVHEDPYFTLLGGYYCERVSADGHPAVNISHLFGIILDASEGFGLQPGNQMLGDLWEMEDLVGSSRKSFINERLRGENGWTFVVSYKPQRRQYPFSGRPISIERLCPVPSTLNLALRPALPYFQDVFASVAPTHPMPDSYTWDWGDGSAPETTLIPEALHRYARSQGSDEHYTPQLTLNGPAGCQSAVTGAVTIPGYCPSLSILSLAVTPLDHLQAEARITLSVWDGELNSFEWNWGDGSPIEITQTPVARHVYNRKFGPQPALTLRVTGRGPGGCAALTETQVQIPEAPCPSILSFSASLEIEPDGSALVTAAALAHHGGHTTYSWDWGDGSATETTASPSAMHAYARQAGSGATFQIRLTGSGPANCQSASGTEVFIPGVCPAVGPLRIEAVSVSDTELQALATLQVTGPTPVSFEWNWGDGAVETTTAPQATHTYARPAGDQTSFAITVVASGPADCGAAQSVTGEVRIPGVCPAGQQVQLVPGDRIGDLHSITARVIASGPAPASVVWNWGDGSEPETTSGLEAIHSFRVAHGEKRLFQVQAALLGPGSCQSQLKASIELSTPCETDLEIAYTLGSSEGLNQKVRFAAVILGPQPTEFLWSFGDGSLEVVTTAPEVDHIYPLSLGERQVFQAGVRATVTGACAAIARTTIALPLTCPIPESLVWEADPHTPRQITARVLSANGQPGRFVWNWGDGTPPETTETPEARHAYEVHYGDARNFHLQVEVSGPGACGMHLLSAAVPLPGICPTGLALSAQQTDLLPDSVTFTLTVESADGLSAIPAFEWHFGDGSPTVITQGPEVSHAFPRLKGYDARWPVTVINLGPGGCRGSAEMLIAAPQGELCPLILRVDQVVSHQDDQQVTFAFSPVLVHGQPELFVWTWGDGGPDTQTDEPTVYKTYPKSQQVNEYAISVTAAGPGDCSAASHLRVVTPAAPVACPDVQGIMVVNEETLQGEYRVQLEAKIAGASPEQFIWTWHGQTGPLIQSTNRAWAHFPRGTSQIPITVEVKTKGPGACEGHARRVIDVPGKVRNPLLCRLIQYLMAFLGAVTAGGLVVALAALVWDLLTPGRLILAMIPAGLGAVLVGLLALLGKRLPCPLGRCEWLATGWASGIGGLVVSFFLLECIPWIPFAASFFVATGLLAFFWFRDCTANRSAIVTLLTLLLGFAGGFLVALLVANPVLNC